MSTWLVPAAAQEAGSGFRMIAPPAPGTKKLITVQIDPNADVYHITPESKPRMPGDPRPKAAFQLPDGLIPSTPTDFDWYWQRVPPQIGVDSATRFQSALEIARLDAEKIGTPTLQTLRDIAAAHGVDILSSTVGTQVSPALVLAVIAVESAGSANAISHAGAKGIMQLMPDTAKRFGVGDIMDPSQNIKGGIAYLDWLMKTFNRDPVLALAGYNAGEGAVTSAQGVPPYAETRAYVPKVIAAWDIARQLCITPPELMTDGCVFVGPQVAQGG